MSDFRLLAKIKELCQSHATLLWLEGSTTVRVTKLRLSRSRLVLTLEGGTTKILRFERFAVTEVGLQFWCQGRPSVLYRWDLVPKNSWTSHDTNANNPPDTPCQPLAQKP